MHTLAADLRYAFRVLLRAPSFAAAVIAVLALGLGDAAIACRERDEPADVFAPQPPAIAPTTTKGSAPRTTASGSGTSGDSCERSSSHAKNRTNARRRCVT